MSGKTPQSAIEDPVERDLPPPSAHQSDRPTKVATACRNQAEQGQRNGETASSSPESGSLNGDAKRSGKSRRRKKRSSNNESRPAENTDKANVKPDKRSSGAPTRTPAGLVGLQAECANVWLERSAYERAESLYQCWLAGFANGSTKSNRFPPSTGRRSNSPSTAAPTSPGRACHHGDQVACHHIVQEVWVNKPTFDQAERRFVEESVQPSIPNSLNLQVPFDISAAPRTPDEGYQSLDPTPLTPVLQQAAARQSVNGLPRLPVELLRGVWLDKPLYDRAEATFYQNLYGPDSSKRHSSSSSSCSSSRSCEHPQSLVEEEEEEDEEEEVLVEEKRVVPQGKAEIFHALHPIQEEEEPVDVPEEDEEVSAPGIQFFLHPHSEPIWLDRWRFDSAESRFHVCGAGKVVKAKKDRRPPREKNMSVLDFLSQDKIWFDKPRYDEAERRFYEHANCSSHNTAQDVGATSILQDIARARENIQKSLAGTPPTNNGVPAGDQEAEVISRINNLEQENQSLYKVVGELRASLSRLECRVSVLEKCPPAVTSLPVPAAPYPNGHKASVPKEEEEEEEDEDLDLFGSDQDEEAEKLKDQRLKEYAERKAAKPAIIAKSSILLDVKPWDDETDMARLEECVRSVEADGLLWGTSRLMPVGYGIKKLQISCVVEDDKVGTDLLEDEITKFEDYVQSVDVAAFNKI